MTDTFITRIDSTTVTLKLNVMDERGAVAWSLGGALKGKAILVFCKTLDRVVEWLQQEHISPTDFNIMAQCGCRFVLHWDGSSLCTVNDSVKKCPSCQHAH